MMMMSGGGGGGGSSMGIVLIGGIVVIGVGIGIYMYTKSKATATSTTTPSQTIETAKPPPTTDQKPTASQPNVGGERIENVVVEENNNITARCSLSTQHPVWQNIIWQAHDGGGIWSDPTNLNKSCMGQNPCVVPATNTILGGDPWYGHKKVFKGAYFCSN
jgi:hypothetical protein